MNGVGVGGIEVMCWEKKRKEKEIKEKVSKCFHRASNDDETHARYEYVSMQSRGGDRPPTFIPFPFQHQSRHRNNLSYLLTYLNTYLPPPLPPPLSALLHRPQHNLRPIEITNRNQNILRPLPLIPTLHLPKNLHQPNRRIPRLRKRILLSQTDPRAAIKR